MLLRQNQTWIGIGYCVRTNDATGRLWLPECGPGQLGVGSLYRFVASTNVIQNNGLRSDPTQLLAAFSSACRPAQRLTGHLQPNLRWRHPLPLPCLRHQRLPHLLATAPAPMRSTAPTPSALPPGTTAPSDRRWQSRPLVTRTIWLACISAATPCPLRWRWNSASSNSTLGPLQLDGHPRCPTQLPAEHQLLPQQPRPPLPPAHPHSQR